MQYGVVFRPKSGQSISGDAYLVIDLEDIYLVAVADGLGSGKEAALAARQAMMTVGEHVWAELPDILWRCHLALRSMRGAVMSVLRIKVDARSGGGQVSYAGVGNVDFCSQTANGFRPLNAYGIIGSRFPKVRQFEGVYAPGDLFVLSTDGITRQFNLDKIQPTPGQSPQALAQTIADKFSRLEDDVTVLVVV